MLSETKVSDNDGSADRGYRLTPSRTLETLGKHRMPNQEGTP